MPTFTFIVKGKNEKLENRLNMCRISASRNWFLKVHSVCISNIAPELSKVVLALKSSLVNILAENNQGRPVLELVPLHLLDCGVDKKETTYFGTDTFFFVNNLTTNIHWYIEPVFDVDRSVASKIANLKVAIHCSLYGP